MLFDGPDICLQLGFQLSPETEFKEQFEQNEIRCQNKTLHQVIEQRRFPFLKHPVANELAYPSQHKQCCLLRERHANPMSVESDVHER